MRARRIDYRRLPKRTVDSILRHAERTINSGVKKDLDYDSRDIFQTSRYYVRCTRYVPLFCFEVHKDAKIKPILSYFQANHNPATRLPFPIDLIDENVSIPQGFTKEFIEEIEALLIKDPKLDKFDLSDYFMSINPQKESELKDRQI